MIRKKVFILMTATLMLTAYQLFAQKKALDPVLFTYGGKPVNKSEFLRMYTKNINNQKPDFSEKALKEYLTLYSRFKMKVSEAESLRMDTLPGIQAELGGYKKQLAKTYLTDKEVTDKLVKEAYDRMKKDVRVAHILIGTPRGSDDTLAAYKKADSLYNVLTAGADFANLAKSVSEDKQSSVNGGDIGFITAMQVVYPFETEAYQTPIGKFSKPVRTLYGYHIIKKLDERAARGEIQVSQIMVGVQKSAGKEGEAKSKDRIDSVLVMLKKGEKFESLVEKYSEDKFSKNTQGTLASFAVGQMVPEFEDAAFGLKNPGDMTEPVRTEFGYHIIRLIKKTPVRPFDTIKTELTRKVEKDGRIDIARRLYTEKIKQKVNFKEDVSALEELIAAIPDTNLRNGLFNASDYKRFNKRIFEMTGVTFTQSDFANYIEQYTKGKIYGQKESTLRSLYKNYTDKAIYDFQENKLFDENEEYRNLLTEYRDGIMLFELTDKTVWSKASVDTTGLQQFYEKNKEKYIWQPAIKGVVYKTVDESYAKKLVMELSNPNNKTPDEVAKAVNGDGSQGFVTFESGKYEKSRFPVGTKLVAGKHAAYFKNKDESYTLVDVKEVFDTPTQKTLSEAKGYVVSEYQEYLEKQWLAELENKYPVVVNQETLKAMIR